MRRRIVFGGVLCIAALARLWGLADYPPGLYPDQAVNGEDALEILQGNFQVFSPRNNGRESLFFYAQALTIGLFGVGTQSLLLASALVGITTVAVTYAAGNKLFGAGAALLAAFFLATNPWHVTLSRTGFRAVAVPLLISLAVWFIGRMLKSARGLPQMRDAAFAGLWVGLGLYTYTAYRAFGLFLLLSVLWALLRAAVRPAFRVRVRQYVVPSALAAGVAMVVALPLFAFFMAHPTNAGVRVQHVSIFNPDLNQGDPWATFLRMTVRTLRAFVWNGDGNPRHNVPLPSLPYVPGGIHHYQGGGAPFLSLLPAVCVLMGVLVAVRRAPWLLLLFFVMLLPAVSTAEGIPHGLRTVGVIPAHVWLAGIGGMWFWQRVRAYPWASVRVAAGVTATVALSLTTLSDLRLYFGVARNSPLAHYEYRGDLTDVSKYLNERARRTGQRAPLPYLVLDDFSAQTVHFLTTPTGYPYRLLKPAESHLQKFAPGDVMIFAQSSLSDVSRVLSASPEVHVVLDRANRFRETTMLVLAPR